MKEYKYDFSVVMAVYNVEPYIREAVESLIHQTLGFSRIQLIMVDDGSTDRSGKICDEYGKKYPENVVVIHKENGRQASARNAGLPYAKGRYVNFMDPDDVMGRDAFEKVRGFMDTEGIDADVSCIPIFFFGDRKEPHPLNNKFDGGTQVLNLLKDDNADCILLSAASAFYRDRIIEQIVFDTALYHAEDAKVNLQILLKNPRLGIIADTEYLYRKYGGSTLDKSSKRTESYGLYLERFTLWGLDAAQKQYGIVPLFVQNAMMYELQWKIKQPKVPQGVLTEQQEKVYEELIGKALERISDEVIDSQHYLSQEQKLLAFLKKYKTAPEIEVCTRSAVTQGDIRLQYGRTVAARVSEMKTVWEFLKVDQKSNSCTVEGYHLISGIPADRVNPILLIDGKEINCDKIERKRKQRLFLGQPYCEALGFRFRFSLTASKLKIVPGVRVDGISIIRKNCSYGNFFPVCSTYEYSYALISGRMITQKDGRIIIRSIKSKSMFAVFQELHFLHEIWRKNLLGGRKAVFGRAYYHLLNPLKRKKLWIVSDRIMKADDNGEALFRYLMKHKPDNTRIVFAVSKDSPDYKRMKEIGECIDAMSFQHKLQYLLCDINISSHADAVTGNPFFGHHDALRDMLIHQKYVFLQHGITKDDISGWINRYQKDMSGVICAAYPERDSFLKGDYGYTNNEIWLTGFPRFDRLYNDEKKVVTIMPTWRKNLMRTLDSKTGRWKLADGFEKSEYYQFYDDLLNSETLLNCLSEHGYRLQFFPHPNIQPFANKFRHDRRVEFLPASTSYRHVYATSSLLITDYSSAVFDFAYLRKPLLYCQFDKDTFFRGEHLYTKGYFDYEKDGFGEVVYTLEDTIRLICKYIENNCQLKDIYKARIDHFFAFNDRSNCRRVTEKILELLSE